MLYFLNVGCFECDMFRMLDVADSQCCRCWRFEMWDVQDVRYSQCGMLRI